MLRSKLRPVQIMATTSSTEQSLDFKRSTRHNAHSTASNALMNACIDVNNVCADREGPTDSACTKCKRHAWYRTSQ
jgi:hypothetical protein